LAICTAKAKSISNGSSNSKEEVKSTLVRLLNTNSCCEICRKCTFDKKKLKAHRKICLLKFEKKREEEDEATFNFETNDTTEPTMVNSVLSEKNREINRTIPIDKALNLKQNIEKIIIKKKKKKIKNNDNSIDLNFLFE